MAVDLTPIVDAYISRYIVGFVLVAGDNPQPLGSGVLVRCKTIQGILTCGHVLEWLPTTGSFGIVQFGVVADRLQTTRMDAASTIPGSVVFYTPPATAGGPDLAFIPVPAADFAKLTAIGSVIDLDGQQAKAQQPKPANATGHVEAVAGIVGQMTAPAQTTGHRVVLTAQGLINMGEVTSVSQSGQWDLLNFEPRPAAGFVLPTNYQGTSGGGMWRLYLAGTDPDFTVVEARLTGIAYWQNLKIPPHGVIIGHGPQSLYGHLLNEIYKRWR